MKNNLNIPEYRALKKDAENEYIIGSLIKSNTMCFIAVGNGGGLITYRENKISDINIIEIDPTTLSIHFKNMIDSDGKKIFASLDSKNGIGGDILLYDDSKDIREMLVKYQYYSIDLNPIKIIKDSYRFNGCTLDERLKIIGIQK